MIWIVASLFCDNVDDLNWAISSLGGKRMDDWVPWVPTNLDCLFEALIPVMILQI